MIDRLPDWGGGFSETLAWATAVNLPRDGEAEERRLIRTSPVRQLAFSTHIDAQLDLALHRIWADDHTVPYLPGATMSTTTGAAVTQIATPVDPWMLGYEVDRPAIVLSADGSRQVVNVTAVTPGGTIFVDPAVDIVDGDQVMPGVPAKLTPTLQVQRYNAVWRSTELTVTAIQSARWSSPGGNDEFGLTGVETFAPEAGAAPVEVFIRESSSQSEGAARRLFEYNSGLGLSHYTDVDGITRVSFAQSHDVFERDELWDIRRMLYRRRGRFSPCFVPAGHSLEFLGTRSALSANWWAITDPVWSSDVSDARGAIVVHRADGTKSYHTFESLADSDHATIPVPDGEAWFVNPYPAIDVLDVDDVLAIDWLVYARLATDVVTIQWVSSQVAQLVLEWSPLQWPAAWEAAA